jgi:hypothetical protein
MRPLGIEDDGRGEYGARERAAPGLVDAASSERSRRAVMPFPFEVGLQRLGDRARRDRTRARVQLREARAQPVAAILRVEPVAERLRQVLGRGLVLQQLGHDELPERMFGSPT